MIRSYWWNEAVGAGNFGDMLTPHLCRWLMGQSIEWVPIERADLIAVGSLLEPIFWESEANTKFRGCIWGTGCMHGHSAMSFPHARVTALRGHLTTERINCPDKDQAVLGDPGLLASLLAKPERKRWKLGLIPHWSERDHPLLAQIASQHAEIVFIDICSPVEEVISIVNRCEFILSSALHGLILADSLQIPNEWLRLNPHQPDQYGLPEFKFQDYYTLFGLQEKTYQTIQQADTLETLLAKFGPYERLGLEDLQNNLLEAFPFRRTPPLTSSCKEQLDQSDADPIPALQEHSVAAKPVVSIIMPVYNGEGLIERAIDSVRRQTSDEWELLITDDGSTDNTAAIVEQITTQDSRVRLFQLPENSGIGRGRNLALQHARGEMIAYLDCDDEYYPMHVENIVTLKHKGDVLVFCYDIQTAPGENGRQSVYTWNPVIAKPKFFRENICTPLGVVHHRSWLDRLGGFNELLWREEDFDLWRRMARAGAEFVYVPIKSGRYHVRRTSLSRVWRAAAYQRRGLEANFRLRKPLYGETTPKRSRSVQKIAILTPDFAFDATNPVMVRLIEASKLLTTKKFTCHIFCGSWMGAVAPVGPEKIVKLSRYDCRIRQLRIDADRYRLLDIDLDGVSLTIFEDNPHKGGWTRSEGQQHFEATTARFLDDVSPDSVLILGSGQIVQKLASTARQRDLPVVHWLDSEPPANLNFFHAIDYVIVESAQKRSRLWDQSGLASHVLNVPIGIDKTDPYALPVSDFFRDLHPQPGPPYIPREIQTEGSSDQAISDWVPIVDKPNIVVLGLDNSGTTILTRMLHALGWRKEDADEEYAESVSVREVNISCIRSGHFPIEQAGEILERFPSPWAIKDPRFVRTLHQWRVLLETQRPLLIWITRSREAVLASRRRRGENDFQGLIYEQAISTARSQFDCWPWGKLHLSYESLTEAVNLFDCERGQRQEK